MPKRIAIVYNQPEPSLYDKNLESAAVSGVLESVEGVHQALQKLKYKVSILPLTPPEESVRNSVSKMDETLVFNLFEGFPGKPETEPLVPQILSQMDKQYTGCPAAALRMALDKFGMKKKLKTSGIPTPDFQLLNPGKSSIFRLNFPCIVKPCHQDASHGITPDSVVNDKASLERQIHRIYESYHNQSIVEEYIDGREFNVTVIGDSHPELLPISEIVYTLPPDMPSILTYQAKWEQDSVYYKNTNVVCPANVTEKEHDSIKKMAINAFRLLNCSGYARVDMRMDKLSVKLYVIEVNPNPDISPGAGVAIQANAAGIKYEKLIEKIVKLALDRKRHEPQSASPISFRQNRIINNIKKHAGI